MMARRARTLALREKMISGGVKSASDLVALNLDIRQFMQDVIDTCTGPELLRAVWQAIVGRAPENPGEKYHHGITILDPTCGSGAFLFAALNVLEQLYEACLDRMEGFVEDALKLGKPVESDFVNILDEVGRHPSRRYFIYKSVILHNLFGVDIMHEAVEICKLRLFLKLVSQVDADKELEPLPDIDFNIRAGNTLVGYATEAQFDAANTLASDQGHRELIKTSTADLAELFGRFRALQTSHDGKITADDKRLLRDRLEHIRLSIVLVHRGKDGLFSTKYNKWNTHARPNLFPLLQYQPNSGQYNWEGSIPKIGSEIEPEILAKFSKSAMPIGAVIRPRQKHVIYYTRKLSGFVQILSFIPSITDDDGIERPPSELKEIAFSDRLDAETALVLLNSSLFYWFLTIYSDVRNLNKREVLGFPMARIAVVLPTSPQTPANRTFHGRPPPLLAVGRRPHYE